MDFRSNWQAPRAHRDHLAVDGSFDGTEIQVRVFNGLETRNLPTILCDSVTLHEFTGQREEMMQGNFGAQLGARVSTRNTGRVDLPLGDSYDHPVSVVAVFWSGNRAIMWDEPRLMEPGSTYHIVPPVEIELC